MTGICPYGFLISSFQTLFYLFSRRYLYQFPSRGATEGGSVDIRRHSFTSLSQALSHDSSFLSPHTYSIVVCKAAIYPRRNPRSFLRGFCTYADSSIPPPCTYIRRACRYTHEHTQRCIFRTCPASRAFCDLEPLLPTQSGSVRAHECARQGCELVSINMLLSHLPRE